MAELGVFAGSCGPISSDSSPHIPSQQTTTTADCRPVGPYPLEHDACIELTRKHLPPMLRRVATSLRTTIGYALSSLGRLYHPGQPADEQCDQYPA